MIFTKAKIADERRQYFRIKNWLFLSFERVDKPDEKELIEDIDALSSPRIQLLNELHHLEEDNTKFMSSLSTDISHVTKHMDKMNRKIGLLTQYIIQSLDIEYNELQEVDLSAGGIRFHSKVSLRAKHQVKMEIVIIPEYYGVVTFAEVVDCKKSKNKEGYDIAFKFIRISQTDQDAIVRHIFKVQSKQLRTSKGLQTKDELN
ncbi:MAG: c-di-GMP-binding flagellar brake protein YcgR [Polaribacter sp.]